VKINQDVTLTFSPNEFGDLQDVASRVLSLYERNILILTESERYLLFCLQEA